MTATATIPTVTTCQTCRFVVLADAPKCACNLGRSTLPPVQPSPDVVTLVMRAQDDLCAIWAEIRRAILAQQTGDRRLRNKRVAEVRRLQGRLTESVAAIGGAFIPADDEPAQTDETAAEAIAAASPPQDPHLAHWIAGNMRGPGCGSKGVDVRGDG